MSEAREEKRLRPLDRPFISNQGTSELILPHGPEATLIQIEGADDAESTAMSVYFGVEGDPGDPLKLMNPDIVAKISWGNRKAGHEAEIDVVNGGGFCVHASGLRVSVRNLDEAATGNVLKVMAHVAYFTRQHYYQPPKRTINIGAIPAMSAGGVFPVPRYATTVDVVSAPNTVAIPGLVGLNFLTWDGTLEYSVPPLVGPSIPIGNRIRFIRPFNFSAVATTNGALMFGLTL